MFLRFVIGIRDPDSGRQQGIFQAGGDLYKSGAMVEADMNRLDIVRDWFNLNLKAPTRFSLSLRPNKKNQAICWFRDSATAHIDWMREYQRILESYDIPVEIIRTRRPGYIVYEDDHQVAAYPFADTPC